MGCRAPGPDPQTAYPTPLPTATPFVLVWPAYPTPLPTATPFVLVWPAFPTPLPTATPQPTPTPQPTATPFPAFATTPVSTFPEISPPLWTLEDIVLRKIAPALFVLEELRCTAIAIEEHKYVTAAHCLPENANTNHPAVISYSPWGEYDYVVLQSDVKLTVPLCFDDALELEPIFIVSMGLSFLPAIESGTVVKPYPYKVGTGYNERIRLTPQVGKGYSGGAVIDSDGCVIGMLSSGTDLYSLAIPIGIILDRSRWRN